MTTENAQGSATTGAELSYCEPVTATAYSPTHIRRRAVSEPLRTGGGIVGEALCGRDMRLGWDLPTPVLSTVASHRRIPQDQPGRLCLRCADLALDAP